SGLFEPHVVHGDAAQPPRPHEHGRGPGGTGAVRGPPAGGVRVERAVGDEKLRRAGERPAAAGPGGRASRPDRAAAPEPLPEDPPAGVCRGGAPRAAGHPGRPGLAPGTPARRARRARHSLRRPDGGRALVRAADGRPAVLRVFDRGRSVAAGVQGGAANIGVARPMYRSRPANAAGLVRTPNAAAWARAFNAPASARATEATGSAALGRAAALPPRPQAPCRRGSAALPRTAARPAPRTRPPR